MTGRIVTVAQQKGGSGKTTVAAHLAVAWTGAGRVAILDVDPQGSLGEWFEARERSLGEDRTGITFRTASGWGAKREARALSRDHDFVLLDTPPKSDLEARPAIETADLVVVPVQPTPVDLWASGATLELVGRERRPALLVVNRVPPRGSMAETVMAELAALGPAAAARLGNRVAFAASMGEGRTVMETEPAGKAAAEVVALARELGERLRAG
ncbi:ParA family partition ATPase [Faunimonas sp. B44]|uniref:ParA family partition ATPase n=1 Tax=Faunimonas sp. B44 TaxID=3461493 RepID=UPI00404453FF